MFSWQIQCLSGNGRVSAGASSDRLRRVAVVVDDEPIVRMCTADLLDEIGYAVIEAGSADPVCQACSSRSVGAPVAGSATANRDLQALCANLYRSAAWETMPYNRIPGQRSATA